MIRVRLTRLVSKHNNLRTDVVDGEIDSWPVVGSHLWLTGDGLDDKNAMRSVYTTEVKEIRSLADGSCELDTLNSTYKIERI